MGIAELLITLITVVASLCGALLSIAIPLAVVGFIIYRIRSGGAVVIQSSIPGVAEAIAGAVTPAQQASDKRMKRVTCRTCGASKLQPPKTAYMYCDYCGTLVDWDFKIACQTAGSAKPGPEYERLSAAEAPVQEQARVAGDKKTYGKSLYKVFGAHMEHCPASYSPRIGDPQYREALLRFTVRSYLAAAFDPDARGREVAMTQAMKGMKWLPGFGTTRAEPQSFRAMVDTYKAYTQRFLDLCAPFMDTHPDGITHEMSFSMSASTFVQGWLPYLDKTQQDAIIDELGLGGEYVDLKPVETTSRHCGGCGTELKVVEGAKKMVCESCGRMNDVGRPEISCTSCGGPLSLPVGKDRFSCPSCQAELRVDGVAPV
jgi:LSD1 subclass zinc finger protein